MWCLLPIVIWAGSAEHRESFWSESLYVNYSQKEKKNTAAIYPRSTTAFWNIVI